ncbi:hypothetical protein ACHHYP_01348 [Achlya hypogyna]|uniref:Ankyrin repeat domain containing protein n=1 Tax=Achlya hypogyna TaxID=1202772 RepID=A0A1V9ZTE5_ACHHY|nr:hypothetical protein ACHHYP_01348 [Achlya hypogyna]
MKQAHSILLVLADRSLFPLIASYQSGLFRDVIPLFKAWEARSMPTKIASMRSFLVQAMSAPLLVLHSVIATDDAHLVDRIFRCTGAKSATALDFAAKVGALNVVCYLHATGHGCSTRAMDYAAQNGHAEVLRFLHEHRSEGCSRDAMDFAAQNGHMDVVQYLHDVVGVAGTAKALDWAARNGHIDVLRFLHPRRSEGCTAYAMDYAAQNGHLEVVELLHGYGAPCSAAALDMAAANGHIHVVRFLHEHRTEGATVRALDNAARGGHLPVVIFLHDHRPEGGSTDAIDSAAAHGHDDVVAYLLAHRRDGWTVRAVDAAAVHGYVPILERLFRADAARAVCSPRGLLHVVQVAQMESLTWLLACVPESLAAVADGLMERAITHDRIEVVDALWSAGFYAGVTPSWLQLAEKTGHEAIVFYLSRLN